MANLLHSIHAHPMIVHFPIALLTGAFVFELLSLVFKKESLHHTAVQIFIAGTLMSCAAVTTGLLEEEFVKVHHPILETHETFGLWTMGISLASLPLLFLVHKFKKSIYRPVFLAVLVIVIGCLFWTANNGGRLVYEYGVGIAN